MKLGNKKAIIYSLKSFFKKDWELLIFFVTSKCNLRCKYCFNENNLNSGENDLSFEEISKMVSKLPASIRTILFSGGEPWIREDFTKIVGLFVKKGISNFGIPSNGMATEIIVNKLKEISEKYPQASFISCISLDSFRENHEEFRGAGTFEKAIKSAREIAKLSRERKNILSLVNSVATKKSIGQLSEFVDFVFKKIKPTLHTIDVVRSECNTKNEDFNQFSREEWAALEKNRLKINKLYRSDDILHGLYQKRERIITSVQKDVISGNKKWPARCPAGQTSLVLYSEGNVAFCENKKPVGNIRNFNYGVFETIRGSLANYLSLTRNHKCDCNHSVYLRQAIEYDFPLIVLKDLAKNVRNKIFKP